jgi:DNA repair photolyase
MLNQKIKGRGAQQNPKNRFEKLHIENTEYDQNFVDEEFDQPLKTRTIFYKDESKSIIAKNDSEDVGFDYSINPYRGCEHGCVYCYARPTHEFLGFSSGIDFESKIMVKEEAPKLLEHELKKKSYVPKLIMFSGNTDCYQPIERRLKLTRELLKVCLKFRNPVSIITKNSMVERDIDILTQLADLELVTVTLSITTLDKNLAHKMEPRTSSPEMRLNTIKQLSGDKIPAGVNVAPVIPGLNDKEIPNVIKKASENGATHAGYIMLRLPYSVKDIFTNWINKEFPDRANKILNSIREMRDGKLNSSEFGKRFSGNGELADTIKILFNISCRKYGMNKRPYNLTTQYFTGRSSRQMELF